MKPRSIHTKFGGCLLATLVGLVACDPSIDDTGSTTAESSTGAASTSVTSGPVASSDPTTASGNPTGPGPTMTSPSTLSSSGSSGSSGSDSGGAFLVDPTGGCDALPDGTTAHCSLCDLWLQDCGDGDKCIPWSNDGSGEWNSTRCVPLEPDPAAEGESCDASDLAMGDGCELGAMCWNVDPESSIGTCAALCGGTEAAPACAGATSCVVANEGVLPICLPVCDPLDQGCAQGQACYPGEEAFVCMPIGAPIDVMGQQHAECPLGTFDADEEQLPMCEEQPCCAEFCDVNGPATCAEGEMCVGFDPALPSSGGEGFCAPADSG